LRWAWRPGFFSHSRPRTLGLNPKTPLPETEDVDAVAEGDSTFFSAEQMATLSRLSDLLLPALGDKPGALQAEAPVFLDFLIGISPDVRKNLYTGGLDWLDAESRKKYSTPFARTDASQADALVKPWLRTWMTDHPPTEPHAGFLNIAHADIRTATINSEVWSKAAARDGQSGSAADLFWSPIDPDVYAQDYSRVHVRPSPVVDAPRSSHTTPSYPH
jgi:hypothetical protein